ncbi:MAG: glycosyltransferase family 2 protein [Muribaculaceae bacterium]|nr:glycosyltransferase family 2 protein [Muribaculaceae bacterium]
MSLLLSICIPTFNRAEKLKETLSYISRELSQVDNKKELEIIISDNASSDNTTLIVKEFAERSSTDVKIKYNKNQTNIGLLGNIIKLCELSSAKYIWMVGDDDQYKSGLLNQIINKCHKNYDFIFINHCYINKDFETISLEDGVIDKNLKEDKDKIKHLMTQKIGCLMFMSANIWKREYIKEILKSKVKKNLALPLFFSLYGSKDWNIGIIEDISIIDEVKNISWKDALHQVYLYDIPYYVNNLHKIGYNKELIKEIKNKTHENLLKKRVKYKVRKFIKNFIKK